MNADEQLLLLVDRLHAIRLSITQLQEAANDIEAAIVALRPQGDIVDAKGTPRAVVKPPGLRFNKAKAAELVEEDQLPAVAEVSATKLKQKYPELYEKCRLPGTGKPKVYLKDEDDDDA